MREDAVLALGEGRPGHGLYAVLAHEAERVLLLEEGVQLHLVDGGQFIHRLAEVGQAVRVEVADADGAYPALLVRLGHRAPGVDVVAHRLVYQVEVEVIHAEIFHRAVDRGLCALIAGVGDPELGGDKEVGAVHAALGYGLADGALVSVALGGVDEPVAGVDGVEHHALALVEVADLKYAEALFGHLNAVFECYVVHDISSFSCVSDCLRISTALACRAP